MPDPSFTGPLAPKNKKELQEIADGLGISSEGRRDQLMERIKQYLSDNEDTLRNDERFSGLLKRGRGRKGSQQSSTPSQSELDTEPAKPKQEPMRLSPIAESTPVSLRERSARDISFTLKEVDSSPTRPVASTSATSPTPISRVSARATIRDEANTSDEEDEDEELAASSTTPVARRVSISTRPTGSIPGSVSTKVVNKVVTVTDPKSPIEPVRSLLSNSRNIWSLSSLGELVYIFIVITPWQYYTVPNTSLSLPYPPLTSFQTPVFWLTLFHWILPTVIIPASIGSLITFIPNLETSTAPFDPLTAAIVRLAVNALYTHPSYTTSQGITVTTDVLGEHWRLVSASVGVAFAFAEVAGLVVQAVTKAR